METKEIILIAVTIGVMFLIFGVPILSLMWDDRKKKISQKPCRYAKLLNKLDNDYEMCVFEDCYHKIKETSANNIKTVYYNGSTTNVNYYKIKNIEISNSKQSPWVQELKIYSKRDGCDSVSLYPNSQTSCELYDILLDIIVDKLNKQREENDKIREKLQKRDYNNNCRKAYIYLHNLED
jgi:hypothetical protein